MAPTPTPTSGQPAGDLAGRLLAARYRLNRPIASGGMAQVWEATDQVLTRRVAVKLLHAHLADDDSFVRRFHAEAIAAARLAHPSIVSVYDTFTEDGLQAIVMELVVGTTMRADLDQHGPLKLDAILAIGTQVADALGAAHASGLVHRDVKPANILLSADGRVLVADFGIAKAAEGSDITSDGSMVGTAKYLAPEQVEGNAIDGRADLYALGVVLYEALTGVAPFVADTDVGTAFARLHRDATPPRHIRPEIPPAVEAVVQRAMARRPEDRYPDARAMRLALLRAGADPTRAPAVAVAAAASSGEHPVTGPPTPPPPAPPSPGSPAAPPDRPGPAPEPSIDTSPMPEERRRRRRLPWLLVALVAVAAVVAASLWTKNSPATPVTAQALASATSFDPQGDNHVEHQDLVGLAIDADPKTVWHTEFYRDPVHLGPGKTGVGLVVRTKTTARLSKVVVTSPDAGWVAAVYVSPGATPTTLAAWGDPVAKIADGHAGATTVSFHETAGDAVLIWLTRLPSRGTMAIGDVRVAGR